MKTIDYDSENDILFLHKGFLNDEKFETNMLFGDVVLDVSTKGRVRGLEILNAKEYLEADSLSSLKEADFEVLEKEGSKLVILKLKHETMKMILAKQQVFT